MLTAAGTMGSKSKSGSAFFSSFYIPFFHSENQKWKTLRI